ncbi:flavin monoamine oxidase family protein [Duganella sp. Dugasp56]|uniref:flavin monoamine oxidase family protein n=1 Tax=Duganella sp. Dugasp56 TaxID=3243046 RepID=UPI0039B108E6
MAIVNRSPSPDIHAMDVVQDTATTSAAKHDRSATPEATTSTATPPTQSALKRQRLSSPVGQAEAETSQAAVKWPAGEFQSAPFVAAGAQTRRAQTAQTNHAAQTAPLSTSGLPLPPLNPQSVGRYFKQPAGNWTVDRGQLADVVARNLTKLATTAPENRTQLHLEITLHWHCLSEAEQCKVLESLGTDRSSLLGKTAQPATSEQARTPVRDWLEHTLAFMPSDRASRLLNASSSAVQRKLETPFKANTDPAVKQAISERFTDLRMTMPLDHMYDYTGFYWDNNRKVGELPPEVAKNLKVCVVGGGPAGIFAADCLNRIGVKPVVLEQADKIGGRIASETLQGKDGSTTPTRLHPGGMRFHTTRGNVYWSFAKHYNLDNVPFPNPSSVPTSYLIGNEVHEAEPGKTPTNPVMAKIAQDLELALNTSLLKPIRDARDAGDIATFRRLCDEAKKKFDPLNFESGIKQLLKESGVEWNEEEQKTFGSVGIGVGGYKGYYKVGFLEELRFLVDERLEHHVGLLQGADEPLRRVVADADGVENGSLEDQGAIKVNTEVTKIAKKDDKYHVTYTDPTSKEPKTEVYDELFFAGGPHAAKELKLTSEIEGPGALMSPELAHAINSANLVGATKMAIKIPNSEIAGLELPGNLQGDKLFQQSYFLKPAPGGSHHVLYTSYTLGTNSDKVLGQSAEDQLKTYIATLRESAGQNPDDPAHKKLANLATLVENNMENVMYTHWSEKKHFGGAFKMDAPNDLDNTRALFSEPFKGNDGAIFIGEEHTAEGGFASGAVASAIHGVQQMILRHDGKLPPNSPLKQEVL